MLRTKKDFIVILSEEYVVLRIDKIHLVLRRDGLYGATGRRICITTNRQGLFSSKDKEGIYSATDRGLCSATERQELSRATDRQEL